MELIQQNHKTDEHKHPEDAQELHTENDCRHQRYFPFALLSSSSSSSFLVSFVSRLKLDPGDEEEGATFLSPLFSQVWDSRLFLSLSVKRTAWFFHFEKKRDKRSFLRDTPEV